MPVLNLVFEFSLLNITCIFYLFFCMIYSAFGNMKAITLDITLSDTEAWLARPSRLDQPHPPSEAFWVIVKLFNEWQCEGQGLYTVFSPQHTG